MELNIYTVSYVVNSILLVVKLVLYSITKENTLVMMIVDNFNDIVFTFLVSCYNRDRTILYIVVAMVCVIILQVVPLVTLLLSALSILKYSEKIFPYATCGGLLLVNAIVKWSLYYWYSDVASLDEAAILSDQIFDVVTCIAGALANLLMLAVGFEHVFIIDYVVTLAIFAYTVVFWCKAVENSLETHKANATHDATRHEVVIEEIHEDSEHYTEEEVVRDQEEYKTMQEGVGHQRKDVMISV